MNKILVAKFNKNIKHEKKSIIKYIIIKSYNIKILVHKLIFTDKLIKILLINVIEFKKNFIYLYCNLYYKI